MRELRLVRMAICQHIFFLFSAKMPIDILQNRYVEIIPCNDKICITNMHVLICIQGKCASNGRRFVRELRLLLIVICLHIFFLFSLKMHINIALQRFGPIVHRNDKICCINNHILISIQGNCVLCLGVE